MSVVTLGPWEQLGLGALWAMTLLVAFLKGMNVEIERNNAWMAEHVIRLEALADAADQAQSPSSEAGAQ